MPDLPLQASGEVGVGDVELEILESAVDREGAWLTRVWPTMSAMRDRRVPP